MNLFFGILKKMSCGSCVCKSSNACVVSNLKVSRCIFCLAKKLTRGQSNCVFNVLLFDESFHVVAQVVFRFSNVLERLVSCS